MFTYTKRELRLLALSITLFVLLVYNLVLFPLITSIFNNNQKIYSNYVYSRVIPINSYSNEIYKFPTILQKHSSQENQNIINNIKTGNNIIDSEKNTIQEQENIQQSNTANERNIITENQNIKWRIEIPKINLNVHIMEGTTSKVLLKAVGHFENTDKWEGNIGLAAHNRGYQCNFFAKIKNLNIGDEIIYTTTNGKKIYKIQTNKIIKDTDWSYLEATDDNRITLITCEENREDYRRCVQAIEIANYKI